MISVKSCLTDIYIKMGNISKSQLDLAVVLSRLYSVINRLLVESSLSTNNYILSSFEIENSGVYREPVPVSNFLNAVYVEYVSGSGQPETYGKDVEIVNIININNARTDGKLAIAFYQDDDTGDWHYATSVANFDGTFRVWYETDSPAPKGINESIYIADIFKDMVTSWTAYFLMDYVKNMNPATVDRVKASLLQDFMDWKELWKEQLQKGRQQKKVVRTGFMAGM